MTVLLVVMLWAAAATPAPAEENLPPLVRAHYVMGTVFEITIRGEERDAAVAAIRDAFAAIRRSDEVLSHYRDASDLTRLNQLAGEGPVRVDGELYGILSEARRWSRESGGAFDVTVAPLVKLWQRAADRDILPSEDQIDRVRKRVGWGGVALLSGNHVRLAGGLELDLGAIGKGWALDRAVAVLKTHGVECAFLSAGTSTVFGLGAGPSGNGWPVAIRDPERPEGILAKVMLRDEALSTSASNELYFEIEGYRLSHILDPRTGWPAGSSLSSASVIAPSASEADALSTAVYVLGAAEGERLLERLGLGGILGLRHGGAKGGVERIMGETSWDESEHP